MLCSQEISKVFKTVIKRHPLLFCCVLVSFFFAIIQATVVHAATQQPQLPHPILPTETPTTIATPATTPTPTPIAAAGTIAISPLTVSAGNQITVTGENWPVNQPLIVEVGDNTQSGFLVPPSTVNTDGNGSFTTSLTIPANATPGTYQVAAHNNQYGVATHRAFTVTAATPTATPSPTPSPSASPSPSATATATTDGTNGGGGGSALTVLIFSLGGLGILMIVIGVIMLAASSPPAAAR